VIITTCSVSLYCRVLIITLVFYHSSFIRYVPYFDGNSVVCFGLAVRHPLACLFISYSVAQIADNSPDSGDKNVPLYTFFITCVYVGKCVQGAFSRLDPNGTFRNAVKARIPTGRLGEISELSNLACYLVSDYSSWMTGSVSHAVTYDTLCCLTNVSLSLLYCNNNSAYQAVITTIARSFSQEHPQNALFYVKLDPKP